MEKKEEKTLGNVSSMDCTINNMNVQNMEFGKLMILVGANGTGKTFILILVWIAGNTVNMYLMSKNRGATMQFIQFLFDHSFDSQTFSGECTCYFEGISLYFKMDAGKVIDFAVTAQEDIKPNYGPQFMSKNTRTYSDIVRYLKIRKSMGMTYPLTDSQSAKYLELLGLYKVYDVMFIDGLVMKTQNGLKLKVPNFESIKSVVNKDIVAIHCDLSIPDMLYELKDGTKASLCTLGAGEQSWINMTTSVGA